MMPIEVRRCERCHDYSHASKKIHTHQNHKRNEPYNFHIFHFSAFFRFDQRLDCARASCSLHFSDIRLFRIC